MIRSPFHVAGAVQAALGSCGLAAAHLWEQRTGQKQSVTVDFERAAASLISYQMASASGELVMTASSITASTNPPAVADAHRLLPIYICQASCGAGTEAGAISTARSPQLRSWRCWMSTLPSQSMRFSFDCGCGDVHRPGA